MKKIISILMSTLLIAVMLSACSKPTDQGEEPTDGFTVDRVAAEISALSLIHMYAQAQIEPVTVYVLDYNNDGLMDWLVMNTRYRDLGWPTVDGSLKSPTMTLFTFYYSDFDTILTRSAANGRLYISREMTYLDSGYEYLYSFDGTEI